MGRFKLDVWKSRSGTNLTNQKARQKRDSSFGPEVKKVLLKRDSQSLQSFDDDESTVSFS